MKRLTTAVCAPVPLAPGGRNNRMHFVTIFLQFAGFRKSD